MKTGKNIPPAMEESFDNHSGLKAGDEVELRIVKETDLGFTAIINDEQEGLLYYNEIFQPLEIGEIKRGYIKQIREDGKIDLSLQQLGYGHIEESKYRILEKLKTNKGMLPLGDKTSPEEIYQLLKMSKKAFKKAVGALYKERKITVSDFEIKRTKD